ncbi:MAG TPA: type II secretion system F family protein [Mycobacteriales bacterium]|nr:type II secretion system F family protein [Mycobacteriales bacterium]
MSPASVGAMLGLLAGFGLIVAIGASPPMRRTRLDARLAPYLRDTARRSSLVADRNTLTPFPTLERLVGPLLRDLAARVDRIVGGSSSVRHRLDQLGEATSLETFRAEQVLFAGAGLAAGLALAVLATARGTRINPLAFLLIAAVLALAGALLRDQLLTVEVRRRQARLRAEFPTVAELLALAVGAGEGALGALERVTRVSGGELARELRRALAATRSGASVVAALEEMSARSSVPALTRFVDGMAIAVERGTPLADVLRAQAADARDESRRALVEAGGRKEIQMLVPVVFLVLPVTVVFAVFPGLFSVQLAVA